MKNKKKFVMNLKHIVTNIEKIPLWISLPVFILFLSIPAKWSEVPLTKVNKQPATKVKTNLAGPKIIDQTRKKEVLPLEKYKLNLLGLNYFEKSDLPEPLKKLFEKN